MEKSYSASYAAAGVDITAGYRSVELMKQYVARTMTENCIGGLGGFGGLFELDCTGIEHPVLISGTDGVGTKLRIAMLLDKHDTIGIDCVAMCVNDVICAGAKPLVFLDYIACGKNIPEKIAEIVKGDVFAVGDRIDVVGTSKGKGYAGAIKRWNQHRLRESHGTGPVARHAGSMGSCSTPSRVFKGKRLPGHLGAERVTIQNLKVVKVDAENNLIAIKGAIPGPKGSVVCISDSVKA